MNVSHVTHMPNLTLCQVDDIAENDSKGFSLSSDNAMEADVFVIKQQNAIHIYQNHCPHLGLPLEWMPHQFLDLDRHYIQCATHGALFSINTGQCVSGPCLGETLTTIPYAIQGKSIIINTDHIDKKP